MTEKAFYDALLLLSIIFVVPSCLMYLKYHFFENKTLKRLVETQDVVNILKEENSKLLEKIKELEKADSCSK